MITITKKEEVVLNQIKIFNLEYPEGIPEKVLRNELGFYEYDLNQILNILDEKKLISYNNNKVKLSSFEKKINAVDSLQDVKDIELDRKEQESLAMIKELVDENNTVSRYVLEGNLLYGDLKLTDFRMYHIILSLENKGILKPIKKSDGDYYLVIT